MRTEKEIEEMIKKELRLAKEAEELETALKRPIWNATVHYQKAAILGWVLKKNVEL